MAKLTTCTLFGAATSRSKGTHCKSFIDRSFMLRRLFISSIGRQRICFHFRQFMGELFLCFYVDDELSAYTFLIAIL